MGTGGRACPACGRRYVRLSRRTNALERAVGRIGLTPFRCQICSHRFWRFAGGTAPTTRPEADRREYERLPARIMIGIQWADGRREATATEVSLGGATLEAGADVPGGVFLQLTLRPSAGTPVIDVSKALVRHDEAGRLGIEFVDIGEAERRRLGELVLGLLRGHRRG